MNFLDDGSLNPDRHRHRRMTPRRQLSSQKVQASAKRKDGPKLHTHQPKKRPAMSSSPPHDYPARPAAKATATQPPTASSTTGAVAATAPAPSTASAVPTSGAVATVGCSASPTAHDFR